MGQEQTIKSPAKSGENQGFEVVRDEKGRFLKGTSGNPDGTGAGRPVGSISITAEIKKKLLEIPKNQQKTVLDLLVNKIIRKAAVDGDDQMIKQIWSYIDGPPGPAEKSVMQINLLNKNSMEIREDSSDKILA